MTNATEDLDAKIAEATSLREDLERQLETVNLKLLAVKRELSEYTTLKLALSDDTDYTKRPRAFKALCEKASHGENYYVFRKKVEDVLRSFPLPKGVSLRQVGMAPFNAQPSLSLAFEKNVVFTPKDAETLVKLIDFVDLADGVREHTPLNISEWGNAANGVYTLVLDSDNEHARLYRQFFHQTTVIEDGTLAEVMTEISRYYSASQ